jgi:hypothetical protein
MRKAVIPFLFSYSPRFPDCCYSTCIIACNGGGFNLDFNQSRPLTMTVKGLDTCLLPSTGQTFAFFMLETRENTMVKAANRRKTKEIGRV